MAQALLYMYACVVCTVCAIHEYIEQWTKGVGNSYANMKKQRKSKANVDKHL